MSDLSDELRQCRKCGQWKPRSVFGRDGLRLRSECKECRNREIRELRATDPRFQELERAREQQRLEKPGVRERRNAQQRQRRATDPEYRKHRNAPRRERYASDPEYRQAIRARSRQYWATNPNYKERQNARRHERLANEPGYRDRINRQIRGIKQRRRSLPATLTEQEWLETLAHSNYRCAYCGISEQESQAIYGETLHREHVMPVTRGGGYVFGNIVPACRSCNAHKGSRTPEESGMFPKPWK